MFENYLVYVVNTAPECNNYVVEQILLSACTEVIIKITPNTNATGPFDIYKDSLLTTPILTGLTRQQMLDGVSIQLGPCETYEMYIVTQDWIPLTMQDGTLWDTRGFVYPFNVASGITQSDVCLDTSGSITMYAVGIWESADRFYVDELLNIPFDGGNNWFKNNSPGYTSDMLIQIDSDGFPITTYNC